jgi:hypothetical protein
MVAAAGDAGRRRTQGHALLSIAEQLHDNAGQGLLISHWEEPSRLAIIDH